MKDLFNQDDWAEILQAPYLVFKYVSGIDGKVDSKEKEAFMQFCKAKRKFASELIKEILPDNPEQYLQQWDKEIIPKSLVKDKLKSIDMSLDLKADVSEAISFKHHLISLGVFIANASGKIFGNKISDEEEDALVALGNFIDIDVDLLFRSTLVEDILSNIG
jgi:tellurite resistance protein